MLSYSVPRVAAVQTCAELLTRLFGSLQRYSHGAGSCEDRVGRDESSERPQPPRELH